MNAILMTAAAVQTMSSREIADLCEKRHDNVMRDVREMLVQLYGEADLLKFEGIEKDGRNRDQPVFMLPKRETLILVSGYRLELRARIIDRWQQLEADDRRHTMLALNDPATLRGLLETYSARVEQAEAKVSDLQPKADALARIAEADGSVNITAAAKALQMRPKDLFGHLRTNQWIYRRAGATGYLGYQNRVAAGLLEHKVATIQRADGSEKVVEHVLVTAKGLARLATDLSRRLDL